MKLPRLDCWLVQHKLVLSNAPLAKFWTEGISDSSRLPLGGYMPLGLLERKGCCEDYERPLVYNQCYIFKKL